jgi:hypothetical protein
MTTAIAKPANGKARSKKLVTALRDSVSFVTTVIAPSLPCHDPELKAEGQQRM